MNTAVVLESEQELTALCHSVRILVHDREYTKCANLVSHAMGSFPDAPQPHNLMGILCEKCGNHACAMRHFRAAYALDPDYRPAQANLETFGTFFSRGKIDFGDEDGSLNITGRKEI